MTADADPWGRLDAAELAARNGRWDEATDAVLAVLGDARRRGVDELEQRAQRVYQQIHRGEL